ncbi:MAG TPA: hypothetical protein VHG72_14465 [Polyangia bacterium]|nr:hypothetical protein [Polyangia bacterium]
MSRRWTQPGRALLATVALAGSLVVGEQASVRGETVVPPPAPGCAFHAGTLAADTLTRGRVATPTGGRPPGCKPVAVARL